MASRACTLSLETVVSVAYIFRKIKCKLRFHITLPHMQMCRSLSCRCFKRYDWFTNIENWLDITKKTLCLFFSPSLSLYLSLCQYMYIAQLGCKFYVVLSLMLTAKGTYFGLQYSNSVATCLLYVLLYYAELRLQHYKIFVKMQCLDCYFQSIE